MVFICASQRSVPLWIFTQFIQGSKLRALHMFTQPSSISFMRLKWPRRIPGHICFAAKFSSWQLTLAQIDSTSALSKRLPLTHACLLPPSPCKSAYTIRGWK